MSLSFLSASIYLDDYMGPAPFFSHASDWIQSGPWTLELGFLGLVLTLGTLGVAVVTDFP